MMKQSQAEIVVKAFQSGVATVFSYGGIVYHLVGRDSPDGFGTLNIFEAEDCDDCLAFHIADVRLEGRYLVLVHVSGEQTFNFICEVGA